MKTRKVILITGSAKGIGAGLIEQFAKCDYDVIINYNHSEKEALQLKEKIITKYQTKCLCIKANITKEEEIKKMISEIIIEFGKIDILINNAAIAMDNYILDKTKEEFMKVLEVNVVGTFLMNKYVAPYVKEIVNISSTDAIDTYNEVSIDYSASKAAINSMTKSLALILPKIRVIAVMPPWVNTEAIKEMDPVFLKNELDRTHQKKLYEVDEVAKEIFEIVNNDIASGSIVRLKNE